MQVRCSMAGVNWRAFSKRIPAGSNAPVMIVRGFESRHLHQIYVVHFYLAYEMKLKPNLVNISRLRSWFKKPA